MRVKADRNDAWSIAQTDRLVRRQRAAARVRMLRRPVGSDPAAGGDGVEPYASRLKAAPDDIIRMFERQEINIAVAGRGLEDVRRSPRRNGLDRRLALTADAVLTRGPLDRGGGIVMRTRRVAGLLAGIGAEDPAHWPGGGAKGRAMDQRDGEPEQPEGVGRRAVLAAGLGAVWAPQPSPLCQEARRARRPLHHRLRAQRHLFRRAAAGRSTGRTTSSSSSPTRRLSPAPGRRLRDAGARRVATPRHDLPQPLHRLGHVHAVARRDVLRPAAAGERRLRPDGDGLRAEPQDRPAEHGHRLPRSSATAPPISASSSCAATSSCPRAT